MRWTLHKDQFQAMENKFSTTVIGIFWEGLANIIYIHNQTNSVNNYRMDFIIT